MADQKVYVGDVGTVVEVDVQEDVSAATGISYLVSKPDGSGGRTEVTWSATIKGPGDPNVLTYTIIADDLSVEGIYYLQPKLTLTGWTGKGDTVQFRVYPSYK